MGRQDFTWAAVVGAFVACACTSRDALPEHGGSREGGSDASPAASSPSLDAAVAWDASSSVASQPIDAGHESSASREPLDARATPGDAPLACPKIQLGTRLPFEPTGGSWLISGSYLYSSWSYEYCLRGCVVSQGFQRMDLVSGQVEDISDLNASRFAVTGDHIYFLTPEGDVRHTSAPGVPSTVVWRPPSSESQHNNFIAANAADLYWSTFDALTSSFTAMHATVNADGTLSNVSALASGGIFLAADAQGAYWLGESGIEMWPVGGTGAVPISTNPNGPADIFLTVNQDAIFVARSLFGPYRDGGYFPGPDGSYSQSLWLGDFLGSEIVRVERDTLTATEVFRPEGVIHAIVASVDHLLWIDVVQHTYPCWRLWVSDLSGGNPVLVYAGEDRLLTELVTDGTAFFYSDGLGLLRYRP